MKKGLNKKAFLTWAAIAAAWCLAQPCFGQGDRSESPPAAVPPLMQAEELAQSDAQRALEISKAELESATARDDQSQQAAALRVMAIARYFQADFPRALEHAVAAESRYRELGDLGNQASLLSLMGAIHGSSKQFTRALDVYQRALSVSRESGELSGEAIVLMNLGKTHYDLEDYSEAERRYEQSIERFELMLNQDIPFRPDALLFARMGIADALLRQGKTGLAIERAQAVLAATDPDSLNYQNVLAILGEAHLAREELDQAEEYLVRARDEANSTQRPAKRAETLSLLARLAEAHGNHEQALALQRTVNKLNLDIYNERNSSELARLQARYETDFQNQQIEVQALQLQRSRWTIIAVSTLASAAIVLALILIQLYRVKQKSHRALQVLAETDPLTGLLNRRTMYESLKLIEQDAEKAKTISLCLLDIDGFKSVNDRWGHTAGDKLLQEVAATLSGRLSAEDRIARWGGEEFLVLLVGRSQERSLSVAKELCEQVSKLSVDVGDGVEVRVTVSAGLTHFSPNITDAELIQRADNAMYEAKQSGKDQVVEFSRSSVK